MPASVSTGISAFLKACLPMTSASGRPLRRGELMYSEPSTSSIEAAREPHVRGREVPAEREGRHQHVPRVPEPEDGSQPR